MKYIPLKHVYPKDRRTMSILAKSGAMDRDTFHKMEMPVYFNCQGAPKSEAESIPALLERQVQSSVYWEDTIRRMEADGVDTIVEIGPGKTLSSFVKKTAPSIKTYNIDTADDFERVTAALKGEDL